MKRGVDRKLSVTAKRVGLDLQLCISVGFIFATFRNFNWSTERTNIHRGIVYSEGADVVGVIKNKALHVKRFLFLTSLMKSSRVKAP